ncbi:cation:proton antiporter, partial [Salmonella sp. M207]|uniref:cation:proton antiporter domain-containing protein n=1 Tax=Salmonella sp. M207 TaxID=3240296 RepID=UPI00352AB348
VLFRFAVIAAATGTFSVIDAAESFLLLALGGAVVGLAVGLVWLFVVRRLQDEYLTITTSVLVAWAAYLLAEKLHVSGVIATVVAGII